MKKHAIITNALIVMMLFLVMSSVVSVKAQTTTTGDDDNNDDTTTTETEHENENNDNSRTIQVQISATEAEIESQLESGANEDTFKIRVHTDDNGIEFQVSYDTENTTTETGNEFKVTFQDLVEYVDTNANGVYDEEVDNAIQTVQLMQFNPIVYSTENGTGGVIHIFEISTSDGVFTARTYASGDFETVNGTIIAPTQMKIDILINGFDYMDNESQLALNVKLDASTETSYHDETEDEEDGRASDEVAVGIAMSGFNGFFSWAETAKIDGVEYPVNSSIDSVSFGEAKIYLNYARGEEIIHDPKVGFEGILMNSGATIDPTSGIPVIDDLVASGYLPIIAIGGIAVVGLVVFAKRRS